MKLRYLFVVISLLTACVFPSLALADESQVVKDYKARCDKGEAVACAALGLMYWKRCDEGNALGCFDLGMMYANGKGVTKDSFQAVALFRKACDGGTAEGCHNLGVMYYKGAGVRQSDTDALNYFGKACDLKYEGGCEAYARMKKER